MVTSSEAARFGGPGASGGDTGQVPIEHYIRILLHRKWIVLGVWLLISVATAIVSFRLPDIYTSDTVILVDPQKVPEAYVKSTVTGDIRNRLGALSQQILSATRLQKIIESLNLYPEERKSGMAREDIITMMRADISVRVVTDFGASQDLQAFKIMYSGKDARLVAQVANQLAALFIDENLTARQNQAAGTTEFLSNQLGETRKKLEQQEAKLRDFKLKHIGEMPAQETADLQLLSQAQTQLQMEADSLSRVEQQRTYIQAMAAQSAPVVDVDDADQKPRRVNSAQAKPLMAAKSQLATLRARYTDSHPDVQKLQKVVEAEEAKEAASGADATPAEAPVKRSPPPPASLLNPVLQTQLRALDAEIAKHKDEQQRLAKLVSVYRSRLDAIPVREQEIAELERDYATSKEHYSQLLDKQLSAQTATQLEIRQKGEKFDTLDRAQPAERPSKPNRPLINAAGSAVGLILGLLLGIGKEFAGNSIITAKDLAETSSLPVLGEIPIIRTQRDRRTRKKWILVATTAAVIILACGAFLFYHYNVQV
jgi:succinoglycan biosynthesis transport protein ExoP